CFCYRPFRDLHSFPTRRSSDLDVRNGALTFLAGCIVTFGTYALLPGRYFIAWGAVIYGLVRLVRGARVYLKVPAEHRRMGQALIDRKSTRLNSSHEWISYAVFC